MNMKCVSVAAIHTTLQGASAEAIKLISLRPLCLALPLYIGQAVRRQLQQV